ncbi:MAG: AAC(3) family N-acetyltransferase [Candidatus Diapherotrites archaeon]|nr:AAC(3) family N-acetyltransferase [Candidatus Diapherotrites archaeon]
MRSTKQFLAKMLPAPLKRAVKRVLRLPLRLWTYKKKFEGVVIGKEDIVSGLRSLGIKDGDTIFVHSSFSAFGFVKRGPEEVIEALLEAVGRDGNVCMPSFGPLPDDKTFDVRGTPCALGKIPETFRRMPGAKRSLSPTHSVACIGKDADFITKGHLKDETAFGKSSPYYKMMEMGGKVVCLGSPFTRSLTCNYLIEEEASDRFPVRVYEEELREFVVIDEKGKKFFVKKKYHDKSLDPIRVDNRPEIAGWLERLMAEKGRLRRAKIGEAAVRVYAIKGLVDTLRELLQEGKTIYAKE